MNKKREFTEYLTKEFGAVPCELTKEKYEFYKKKIVMNTKGIINNIVNEYFIEVLQFTHDFVEYRVIVDYGNNFVCIETKSDTQIIEDKVGEEIFKTFYYI